jgi:hypothetical protein
MNVCAVIEIALRDIDPGVKIHRRPLRTTDEKLSISVVPLDWAPDEGSYELGRPPEPTIQRYTLAVQAMVKDMEETRGIAKHSELSTRVRHRLYRDLDLELALPTVSVKIENTTETLKRYGTAGQQFMNNQNPKGGFIYLSTLEYWFETQIS